MCLSEFGDAESRKRQGACFVLVLVSRRVSGLFAEFHESPHPTIEVSHTLDPPTHRPFTLTSNTANSQIW